MLQRTYKIIKYFTSIFEFKLSNELIIALRIQTILMRIRIRIGPLKKLYRIRPLPVPQKKTLIRILLYINCEQIFCNIKYRYRYLFAKNLAFKTYL
jgi:hypothetical protein